MPEAVKSRIEGRVGVLTLTEEARGNALTVRLVEAARAVHEEFIARGVRVAVLEAEGAAFCSGRDKEVVRVPGVPPAGAVFIDEIDNSPLVWIAAVDGPVVGAGIHLVSACFHVVAGPGAEFRVPELLDGIYPRPVSAELARVIGPRQTAALLITGGPLSGEAAVAAGLVGEVVGAGEATERALERARTLDGLGVELLATAREGWRTRFGTAPSGV